MNLARYFNIFILYSQFVLEIKSKAIVWFLGMLVSSLILLLFWNMAAYSNGGSIGGWDRSSFTTYYLLIAIAANFFIAHIEKSVALDDIQKGELSAYILRPIHYYTFKFLSELPWRFVEGGFAIIATIMIFVVAPQFIHFSTSLIVLFLAIIMVVLAYFISFTFKMCLGILAFWLTEINGFMQLAEIAMAICGGIIIPLALLPSNVKLAFDLTPFPYMIYYPIVSLLGKLSIQTELYAISGQLIWLFILSLLYKFLWSKGRKKFTGVGQ